MTDEPETEAAEQTAYGKCEQKHYQKIREQELAIFTLKVIADTTKAAATAARKAFDDTVDSFLKFVHGGPDTQQRLPGMEDGTVDAEAWRTVPLSDLGLSGVITEALEEQNGLKTLGELADWTKEFGELIGLNGIGAARAEQLDKAMVKFWQQHPEYCQPQEPEEEDAAQE